MMLRRYHKKKRSVGEFPPAKGFDVPIETNSSKSLEEYTVKELREMCKERGLKGYSKMSEVELIELLEGAE